MSFVRRKKGGRNGQSVYYQRVRTYRNENGKVREEVLEHLGPHPPGDDQPLNHIESRLVLNEIKQEPTQDQLRSLLRTLEVETGSWDYERFGIDLDMLKKTLHLRLK